jgi:hypothetical protein
MSCLLVQGWGVPGPHHHEFDNSGGDRRKPCGDFVNGIEPASSDSQRQEGRCHRDHAHVHHHVREKGPLCKLRQRPEPYGT